MNDAVLKLQRAYESAKIDGTLFELLGRIVSRRKCENEGRKTQSQARIIGNGVFSGAYRVPQWKIGNNFQFSFCSFDKKNVGLHKETFLPRQSFSNTFYLF